MSKVLLDECIPRPLGRYLEGHTVRTAPEMGWASVSNSALIKLAEAQFDVFITVDRGTLYQQNLTSTILGFLVLRAHSNRLEDLLPMTSDILNALKTSATEWFWPLARYSSSFKFIPAHSGATPDS
jgi:hypothetical protein